MSPYTLFSFTHLCPSPLAKIQIHDSRKGISCNFRETHGNFKGQYGWESIEQDLDLLLFDLISTEEYSLCVYVCVMEGMLKES